ncbi:hypothetical protein DMC30DRAFT_413021 [Rhodotorula diobovata]|uniref:Uncharacterized protein n=1 Tax=Rhodotorula diobovata TaxID=5288 RepID=A0A5C5G8N3_9BASI|nr:hypothetical protein DMC30DRAFT_413021 [Rhodotorula diobovata]
MTSLLDLPPELLLRVFQQLGESNSDKERQRDLQRLAPVCKAFHATAVPLLYGDTVNVRSAGRTFLLSRTLAARPDLAVLVHSLAAHSTFDQGHGPSTVAVLRDTPNLVSLELGEPLLQRLGTPAARAALAAKRLTRFSYGFGAGATSLTELAPFLQGWNSLERLELHNVLIVRDSLDRLRSELERTTPAPEDPPLHSAPTYALRGVAVHFETSLQPLPTPPVWSLAAFNWVLGSTNALSSLVLVHTTSGVGLPALFDALVERGCGPTLRRLTIRRFTHVDVQKGLAPPHAVDPSALVQWFPSLSHLALEETPSAPNVLHPTPAFVPPPELRVLELHGDELHRGFQLARTLEAGGGALGKIRLVGPSPTSAEIKLLRWACEEKGVLLEVARAL